MCELLRANLYEFQKYNRESGDAPYFVLPRVQSIARQVSPCALLRAQALPCKNLATNYFLTLPFYRIIRCWQLNVACPGIFLQWRRTALMMSFM